MVRFLERSLRKERGCLIFVQRGAGHSVGDGRYVGVKTGAPVGEKVCPSALASMAPIFFL